MNVLDINKYFPTPMALAINTFKGADKLDPKAYCLPAELWHMVLFYLSLEDLIRFGFTSKHFFDITQNNFIGKRLLGALYQGSDIPYSVFSNKIVAAIKAITEENIDDVTKKSELLNIINDYPIFAIAAIYYQPSRNLLFNDYNTILTIANKHDVVKKIFIKLGCYKAIKQENSALLHDLNLHHDLDLNYSNSNKPNILFEIIDEYDTWQKNRLLISRAQNAIEQNNMVLFIRLISFMNKRQEAQGHHHPSSLYPIRLI